MNNFNKILIPTQYEALVNPLKINLDSISNSFRRYYNISLLKSLIQCNSIVGLKTIPHNQIELKSFYFKCNCRNKFSCSFNYMYQNKISISQYDLIIYASLKKFNAEQTSDNAEQTSDILLIVIGTIKVYFQLFRRVISEIMITMNEY